MTTSNRRQLIASATGAASVVASAAPAIPPAPVARVAVVTDSHFGETLRDPYRWMENDRDPEWLPYLKGQNAHTRALLDTIPGRDKLLARIQQLSGDVVLTRRVQRAGGRLFIEQRPAGADNYRLFVEERGVRRVLVDPTALSSATGHLSLDWWHPSPDGTHIVYGLSKDGSEDSVLHVMKTATAPTCPSASPTPRARTRHGSTTAAASSTTSSPARSIRPSVISTARRASTGSEPIRRSIPF